jgi:hypothetical protein
MRNSDSKLGPITHLLNEWLTEDLSTIDLAGVPKNGWATNEI